MAVSTTVQVTLPAMGESVTEGTVLEWHKAEGERIEADETLVEISTDKVDAEVPAPVSGTVVKIHFADGDTVAVGAVLAEIQPDDGSAPAGAANGASPNGAATAPPAEDAAGEIVDIVTPGAGESVTEGTLLEWHVEVGGAVADGDTIVEISTDKVDVELPAPAAGVITELLAAEGETVTVGQVIARMRLGSGAAAPAPASDARAVRGREPERPAERRRRRRAGRPEGLAGRRARRGRAGRQPPGGHPHRPARPRDEGRCAGRQGLPGTRRAAAVAAGAQPIRGAAAMLAKYMDESRSIPTATSFRTITVTQMDGRRKQLKEAGQKVSFTHLIAYAIAKAGTDVMPVMAHHFAEADGKPQRDRRRRREPRHRRRRREEGRLPHADGARDP